MENKNSHDIKQFPIIALEGIDASGKTTVSQQIQRLFPDAVFYKNLYRPPVDASLVHIKELLNRYRDMRNSASERKDKLVVFDRYVPSELVYSEIKRNYSALEDYPVFMGLLESWGSLSRLSDVKKLVIFWVVAPYHENLERFRNRGDDHTTEEELSTLFDQYVKVMHRISSETLVPVIPIESTFTDSALKSRITSWLDYVAPPDELIKHAEKVWNRAHINYKKP